MQPHQDTHQKFTTASPPSALPSLLHLDTYIKPFVDPDTYSTYHTIIAKLGIRGHKYLQFRKESPARLEKLVEGDDDTKELHIDCAKVHKRFESKNPRFHLLIFGEENVEVDEMGEKVGEVAGEDAEIPDASQEGIGITAGGDLETPPRPIVEVTSSSVAQKVTIAVEAINKTIIQPTIKRTPSTSTISYRAWLQQRKVRFSELHRAWEALWKGAEAGVR
jgi:hypothetical protein